MAETMFETTVVLVIVATVLVLAGRSFCRTATGKKEGKCCGCPSCTCTGVEEEKGERVDGTTGSKQAPATRE